MAGLSAPRVFRVGDLAVTCFRVADLSFSLGELFGETPETARLFGRPLDVKEMLPNYSFLVTGEGAAVVVDPGEFSRLASHYGVPQGRT